MFLKANFLGHCHLLKKIGTYWSDMIRYERFMVWEIQYGRTGNRKRIAKTHLSQHLFQRVSRQGRQTIPYLLMTTLKITFYKNIKGVLVLVNHHFLILGGKKGGGEVNLMSEQNFVSQQIIIFFFTKTLMIMKMNVMISRKTIIVESVFKFLLALQLSLARSIWRV
jgi:hypothetical protein